MISNDAGKIDDALLDLEGLLLAINLVRMDGLDKPGPECHAIAVLSSMAVKQAEKLRATIFVKASSSQGGEAAR